MRGGRRPWHAIMRECSVLQRGLWRRGPTSCLEFDPRRSGCDSQKASRGAGASGPLGLLEGQSRPTRSLEQRGPPLEFGSPESLPEPPCRGSVHLDARIERERQRLEHPLAQCAREAQHMRATV
jgi:hypothetical protein